MSQLRLSLKCCPLMSKVSIVCRVSEQSFYPLTSVMLTFSGWSNCKIGKFCQTFELWLSVWFVVCVLFLPFLHPFLAPFALWSVLSFAVDLFPLSFAAIFVHRIVCICSSLLSILLIGCQYCSLCQHCYKLNEYKCSWNCCGLVDFYPFIAIFCIRTLLL